MTKLGCYLRGRKVGFKKIPAQVKTGLVTSHGSHALNRGKSTGQRKASKMYDDEDFVDPIQDAIMVCTAVERVRVATKILNDNRDRRAPNKILFANIIVLLAACREANTWCAFDTCEALDAIELALERITGFNAAYVDIKLHLLDL